jgi:predicted dinucleotide-binding enzyme
VPAAELAGKTVIDTSNYHPQRDGQIAELDATSTSSSELLAGHMPGAHAVMAFNNIYFKDLGSQGQPAGTPDRRGLPIGGDAAAKRAVADLIEQFGFHVVDAGGLAEGRRCLQPAAGRRRPARCARRGLRPGQAEAQPGGGPSGSDRSRGA